MSVSKKNISYTNNLHDLSDKKTEKEQLKSLNFINIISSKDFIWIAVATALSSFLSLASSFFIMVVYDRVLPNEASHSLYALAIGVGFAVCLDILLKNSRAKIIENSTVEAEKILNNDVFVQYVRSSNSRDKKSIGELSSIMRQVDIYKDFINAASISTLIDLPFSLLFVFVIYSIGGLMFLVPLLCIPIIIILIIAIQPLLKNVSEKIIRFGRQKESVLLDVLGGIEAIKVNGAFKYLQERFLKINNYYYAQSQRAKVLSQSNEYIIYAVQQLSQVSIIIVGFHLYISQQISMGAIIACVILSSRAIAPTAKFGITLTQLNIALSARKNIIKFLGSDTFDRGDGELRADKGDGSGVILKDVTLSFGGYEHSFFSNFNLEIREGERVAIVGRTGAGKSSLLKAINGLLPPENGTIKVKGKNIKNFNEETLPKVIGTVFQDTWLFSGTLRDNIALGYPGISDEHILEVLEKILGFKRSALSLEMIVQDRGSNLSGGEKQGIALARAVIFDPEILLLDEPSSAMDDEVEKNMIALLKGFDKKKTTVIVTHKVALLIVCTRVIVMDRGKIIWDGLTDQYLDMLKSKRHEKKV